MNKSKNSDKIVIELPRIYRRGSPPKIFINQKILQKLKIKSLDKDSPEIAYNILNDLYTNQKLSQSKIARLFGVQNQTVRRWLKRVEIPIKKREDIVSETLIKYNRNAFSNDPFEKAYLIGLRYGDISTQKHGRFIRVSVSSSHPEMLILFRKLFEGYSKVRTYPKYNKSTGAYLWCIYSDVDGTFSFLLDKKNEIPDWIIKEDDLFLAFLSGYFDAEGCISIYPKNRNVQWIIKSNQREILEQIVTKLNEMDFNVKNPIVIKRSDWGIKIGDKYQILNILQKMKLRHGEKILKMKLAKDLIKNNWKISEKSIILRTKIKNDINQFMEKAKISKLSRM